MKKITLLLFSALLLNFGFFSSAYSDSENNTSTHSAKLAYLKQNGDYVRTRFLQKMKKPFDSTKKKKALIIGDSHAQDFFNGVLENNFLNNYQIRTRYIPTRCQIYLDKDMMKYTKDKDKGLCSKSDNLLLAQEQVNEADLIILVASWREWSARELSKTIHNMKLKPQQKLLVIGRKSFSKPLDADYKKLSKKELHNLRNTVDAHQLKINKIMKDSLDKGIFINLHQLVCGSSSSCPAFSDDLKIISFDGGHFTKAGARFITKVLFNNSSLGSL